MCMCVWGVVKERQKQRGNVKNGGDVCVHVRKHIPLCGASPVPQDNVWRGMFLIGLLAMQLSSRAMPPVRH